MLKALGIKSKKSQPAVDDGRKRKYEEQKRLRDQWRYDSARILAITETMREKYGRHKGDFAMGRYEELKAMIKQAVQELDELEKNIKARSDQKASQLAAKYCGKQIEEPSTQQKRTVAGLKNSAAHFASGGSPAGDCNADDLSSKEIDEELSKFRKEILQTKQDYRGEKEKIEKLGAEYQNSKKQRPDQRYQSLKDMIKTVTR